MVVGRLQAGSWPHDAVHVHGPAAAAADQVVVVVTGSGLVARGRPGALDATDETGGTECLEAVVHGLGGHLTQPLPSAGHDGADGEVLLRVVEHGEHGQPGSGDPKTCLAEALLGTGAHP